MRIAMFTNNYKPFIAGVPISIERLSEGLRNAGHEVYIFAPDYGDCGEETYVIRYRTLYKKDEIGIVVGNCFDGRVEKEFARLRFDVIHVHHPVLSGHAALYLGKKYGIPVAYTYHTRYEEYLHYFSPFKASGPAYRRGGVTMYGGEALVRQYIKSFANSCDLIFAPTKMMRDCLESYGTDTVIGILPTGLEDSSFFEDREAAEEIRMRYKGDKKYLFSTVARLEKEKNLDFLLEGAAALKRRLGDCFRIMVIGEGSERGPLRELARRLEIGDNIVFTGKVENRKIKDYQFASDLFLFASKSETQGIVLLEAMAAGTPVIAVRASGVSDIVKNGCNGYMTQENAEQWAEAAGQALSGRGHYLALCRNSVKTASGCRSAEIAAMAEEYYYQMINCGRKQRSSEALTQLLFYLNPCNLFKEKKNML